MKNLKRLILISNLLILVFLGLNNTACSQVESLFGDEEEAGPSDSREEWLYNEECNDKFYEEFEYIYIPLPNSENESFSSPALCEKAKPKNDAEEDDFYKAEKKGMIHMRCEGRPNVITLSKCRLFQVLETRTAYKITTAEGYFLIPTTPYFSFPDGCFIDKIANKGFFRMNCQSTATTQYLDEGEVAEKIIQWDIKVEADGEGEPFIFVPSNQTEEFQKISLCHALTDEESKRYGELQRGYERVKCDEYMGIIDVYETDVHSLTTDIEFLDPSNEMSERLTLGMQITEDANCVLTALSDYHEGKNETREDFYFAQVSCYENGDRSNLPYKEFFLDRVGIAQGLSNRPSYEL